MSALQFLFENQTYRILLIIFLRVYIETRRATGRHSLIPIFPRQKSVFPLAIMHTLYNLGPDQRAFGDDTLEGNHVIQMCRTQSPGIAGKLSKSTNVSAIIVLYIVRLNKFTRVQKAYHIVRGLPRWPARQSLDNLLQGTVKRLRELKRQRKKSALVNLSGLIALTKLELPTHLRVRGYVIGSRQC